RTSGPKARSGWARARWATPSWPRSRRPPPRLPKPRADAPTRFAPASPNQNPGDTSRGAGSRNERNRSPRAGSTPFDDVNDAWGTREKAKRHGIDRTRRLARHGRLRADGPHAGRGRLRTHRAAVLLDQRRGRQGARAGEERDDAAGRVRHHGAQA